MKYSFPVLVVLSLGLVFITSCGKRVTPPARPPQQQAAQATNAMGVTTSVLKEDRKDSEIPPVQTPEDAHLQKAQVPVTNVETVVSEPSAGEGQSASVGSASMPENAEAIANEGTVLSEPPMEKPVDHSTDVKSDAVAPEADFVGVWAVTDTEGDVFDIEILASGSAVSNWSKGVAGARGEVGSWKLEGDQVMVDYDSGWRDVIVAEASGFRKYSYAPGAKRSAAPSNQGVAKRVTGERAAFIGAWQGVGDGTSAMFYWVLRSNGTALETTVSDKTGKWSVVEGKAKIDWEDGSVSEIGGNQAHYVQKTWLAKGNNKTLSSSGTVIKQGQ